MTKPIAKPFLKWAGGKTQLLEQIKTHLPEYIYNSNFTYIEPFVGGGAVLFWMLDNFENMDKAVINDVNKDLTNCYISVKENVNKLINILSQWQNEYYHLLDNEDLKKEYYYSKRTLFNNRIVDQTTQSALLIFLNKTCFNGLYRVNRKNEFNVPIGSYKKPLICDKENLKAVSRVLQKVKILNGDFTNTEKHALPKTFFYFDPPYKPLNDTSSFNSYTKDEFDDAEQVRLKEFCVKMNNLNYQWILSNSDVRGKNPENNFFDDLYSEFNIYRVNARRRINANASKRGKLTELLITNNKYE